MPRITLSLCCVLMLAVALYSGATSSTADAPAEAPARIADDPNFIETLATYGIRFDRHETAVDVGRSVCAALERNVGPSDVANILVETLPITTAEAEVFVLVAVDEFCPELVGSQP